MPRTATPTNVKEILKAVAAAQKAIKVAEADLTKQYDLLLKNHAPFKVGDTVVVNGYACRGKHMTVDRVSIDTVSSRFLASGRVHTGDGLPGRRRGEHRVDLKAAK